MIECTHGPNTPTSEEELKMKKQINKIQLSWKKPGYVFVGVHGKDASSLRKVYTFKHKPGLGFINLDTDIYSFNWDGQNGTDIIWVGNYKSVDEAVAATIEVKPVPEVVAPVVIPVDESGEVHHSKFATIKACIENNIPVYLVGPAGSGKNHTLEQIAWDLGLAFHFTNSIQQEYKLTGFIDAGGKFHETEFYKAFTTGGLFFLDEMDASIPEVLVLLNAAIANRYFEFPNGKVDAHESFRVVAAGNTMGNGADEAYTGRLVLDQATLDRFAIIEFDYDLKIELHLAKGNVDLVNFIRELRAQAKAKGIRATFSYRSITMVTKLEGIMELTEIMTIAVLKGFDKDTVNTFRPEGYTKYHQALRKVQA
jgi:hypothetical protein